MTTNGPTTDETRIADSYQRVLQDVARCATAVRGGDWKHLADLADALARRATHLAVAAGELRDPRTQPRAQVVVESLRPAATTPALVEALHPRRSDPTARTAMADPFTHPDTRPNR